jgi:Flp pilus assembly protein TadB
MTGMRIRQCPRCELRCTSSSELEHHLSMDHPTPKPDLFVPAVVVGSSPQPRAQTPRATDAKAGRRFSRRRGWAPWLLVAGGLIVIAVVLWAVPTPAALVAGALVVALAGAYAWRAHARAGQRRVVDADDTAVQQGLQLEKRR